MQTLPFVNVFVAAMHGSPNLSIDMQQRSLSVTAAQPVVITAAELPAVKLAVRSRSSRRPVASRPRLRCAMISSLT